MCNLHCFDFLDFPRFCYKYTPFLQQNGPCIFILLDFGRRKRNLIFLILFKDIRSRYFIMSRAEAANPELGIILPVEAAGADEQVKAMTDAVLVSNIDRIVADP